MKSTGPWYDLLIAVCGGVGSAAGTLLLSHDTVMSAAVVGTLVFVGLLVVRFLKRNA
jgi:hypothetical protein